MKKKDIYEITIKIIGIVAAYKFIESLIAIVYISFLSVSSNIKFDMGISQTNYSISVILSIILLIVFYALIIFLFLFNTDKILSLLRLNDFSEFTLQIEKKTIYHIAVLLIGFFMLTYSGKELISSTYFQSEVRKTEQTTTELPTNSPDTAQENKISSSTVTSPRTSTTVNYANIVLLLLSIPIIIKSEKLSSIFMPKEKEE